MAADVGCGCSIGWLEVHWKLIGTTLLNHGSPQLSEFKAMISSELLCAVFASLATVEMD